MACRSLSSSILFISFIICGYRQATLLLSGTTENFLGLGKQAIIFAASSLD